MKDKWVGGANSQILISEWTPDKDTPIFTEDRDYIRQHVYVLGTKDPK